MTRKIELTATTKATALPVTYADVEAGYKRLTDVAHRTPVLTSTTINQLTRSQVFFKCETFQRTGSFKFRGAYNALAQLSQHQKQQGVLAAAALLQEVVTAPDHVLHGEKNPHLRVLHRMRSIILKAQPPNCPI